MALQNPGSDKPDVIMVDELDRAQTVDDDEKARQIHLIDEIRVLGLSAEDASFYNSVTPEQRKRITRKVRRSEISSRIGLTIPHRLTFGSCLCWPFCTLFRNWIVPISVSYSRFINTETR